jgi:glycerol-3-phosphate dehydrogenase
MECFDLLVVGGGINGAAIARDAAGRGLTVLLVEKDDLAAHTSSASSKLIHGGLRYLEQGNFRLVRESLQERENLLRNAPHIVRPLKFVLPDPPGGRPWWMIRLGLWTYDLLAGRGSLPRSRSVPRGDTSIRTPLKAENFRLATYWDAWVDDARLVVLNALDAAERGAEIATRTELVGARREGETWSAELSSGRTVQAKMIVNAAGPWVGVVLAQRLKIERRTAVRLVKGSHIVLPRLWQGDHAYLLQQLDGRIVFALPYGAFSLIGTTDVPVSGPDEATISESETDYLCAAANAYFQARTSPADVVWSYSGIRALHDDGASDAKNITRDYHLELDDGPGAKLLSVVGGKITTARALAAEALERLGVGGFKFTATTPLPGGAITPGFNAWLADLAQWIPGPLLQRLATAYGTRLDRLLDGVESMAQFGRHFGAGLYEAEVRYLLATEFAQTADDILWRPN